MFINSQLAGIDICRCHCAKELDVSLRGATRISIRLPVRTILIKSGHAIASNIDCVSVVGCCASNIFVPEPIFLNAVI